MAPPTVASAVSPDSPDALPSTRVLPAPPQGATVYAHATPAWLVRVFRASLAAWAVTLAWLTWHEGSQMPGWARGLAGGLAAAMLAFGAWPAVWRASVKFVASPAGLCFPSNEQLVVRMGRMADEAWLLVPWARIADLRLSRSVGADGSTCVAFDVRVSPEERERFFAHVASPADRDRADPFVFHAAYDDRPPSPHRTLQRLLDIRAQA